MCSANYGDVRSSQFCFAATLAARRATVQDSIARVFFPGRPSQVFGVYAAGISTRMGGVCSLKWGFPMSENTHPARGAFLHATNNCKAITGGNESKWPQEAINPFARYMCSQKGLT